jgi:hypothetical protein
MDSQPEIAVAHIIYFYTYSYKDQTKFAVPMPSVSRQVGPTLGRQVFGAFDDVALVNNLIILVYPHHQTWPCQKLPPPNGDYTKETYLFTRDWQGKMGQRKPDGNVSRLPENISWDHVYQYYFTANLALAAARYMQETRSGNAFLNVIEELKKRPQLAHLDKNPWWPPDTSLPPESMSESGSSNGILTGETASLTGRMWRPPGSR